RNPRRCRRTAARRASWWSCRGPNHSRLAAASVSPGHAADPGAAPPPTALVLTASDRSAAGERPDSSGARVAGRLESLGYEVERALVPDDEARIRDALISGAMKHRLVLTTGGTGLTPRDVTPQATAAVL